MRLFITPDMAARVAAALSDPNTNYLRLVGTDPDTGETGDVRIYVVDQSAVPTYNRTT